MGLTIIDEVEKANSVVSLPAAVRKTIRDRSPDWNGGLDDLPPGEVLWAYLRCHYAKTSFSAAVSEDILEQVIPDIVRLCELLRLSLVIRCKHCCALTVWSVVGRLTASCRPPVSARGRRC